MMDQDALKNLALETLQSPRTAAQKIISLNLSRDILWSSLVLVACLNSIITGLSLLLGDASVLPTLLRNPILFFAIFAGIQVLSIHAFYWTGLAIGGKGDLGDVLALLVWLQALQLVAQVVLFVLVFVSPGLTDILAMAVSVFALWITVNFLTEALNLPSLLHAVGAMVLAAIGIAFGLMILVGLIGLGAMGVPANV
jgi:hypothetical protein